MALGHVTREKDGKKPPTRYYSNKQEKAVSKETAGSQTSNSGATPFQKGDVLIAGYMEGKYTDPRYVHSMGEVQAKVWYTESKKIYYNLIMCLFLRIISV